MNNDSKRVFEALDWASSILEEANCETRVGQLLMQYVLDVDYTHLVMAMQDEVAAADLQKFEEAVHTHIGGMPVQYITHHEEFYGRSFYVDENVLIPRPETEELVHYSLQRMRKLFGHDDIQVADIGTGSGAIAISMKKECAKLHVTATDISAAALAVAKRNAEALEADIQFLEGDLTAPIAHQKWDVVLSNPPYIAQSEVAVMDDSVIKHEPHTALFAEEDGLILYRKLAENLPALMNRPGLIGVEIGYLQGNAVAGFFRQHVEHAKVEVVKDMFGQDRMVFCELTK
ncbi:SAM-dependent methyltransferase [Kurthia sp. 3B1D]|uniref:Release factor glutamine methyltransferase n=1 Tax=Candidatus Kurthia intestinigallinarum TaxID=1562256 RepID=A0A433RU36_9BACL|nr:peptide chain release factor N(5)-glutamine methyltransferase [Kurthia sp. 3B1D]RUS55658.1 SAM-dependent methyltransferase [Kurthia sp. 3B1D]